MIKLKKMKTLPLNRNNLQKWLHKNRLLMASLVKLNNQTGKNNLKNQAPSQISKINPIFQIN